MNTKFRYLLNKQIFPLLQRCPQSYFNTTCTKNLFMESDQKGGYNKDRPSYSKWDHIKRGWKQLGVELELFKQEIVNKFVEDPLHIGQPGVIDKQWELRKERDLENWITTSDADHGEGHSSCSLLLNSYGFGHFTGVLDTTVPKDGKIKRSGYCSLRTKRVRRSFQRDAFYNWLPYTHIVLKVRGDGRSYMLNIGTSGYFDQLWNDMYQYVLYTRGGPYWQISKIPFSKFFFSSKGRIQDLQSPLPLEYVTHFGITAADKINGPFSLEIDYVGLLFDPTHTEEFAYEMYELPRNIAAT